MKKLTSILILILTVSGCATKEGPKGEEGLRGPAGVQGPPGQAGLIGPQAVLKVYDAVESESPPADGNPTYITVKAYCHEGDLLLTGGCDSVINAGADVFAKPESFGAVVDNDGSGWFCKFQHSPAGGDTIKATAHCMATK